MASNLMKPMIIPTFSICDLGSIGMTVWLITKQIISTVYLAKFLQGL